jgi:HEPN/RES N-terminal domain 1/RES domain
VGYAKEEYMRMTEGGLNLFAAQGKFVCADCFSDECLQQFVRDAANDETCSFCGASSDDEAIAAPLEDVVEHIATCLSFLFDDAANCLPFDGREGGYQGITFDSSEIVAEVGLEEALTNDDGALLEAITDALGDRAWCERDPFALREHERLSFSWDRFSDYIKHERRFFFLSESPAYAEDQGGDTLLGPADVLAVIAKYCEELHLLTTVPAGTRVFRARRQDPGPRFQTALQLGPPPPGGACVPNRMSPPGVVMTYVAEDQPTALAETVPSNKSFRRRRYAVGAFTTTKELLVLDLSAVSGVPSLFDLGAAPKRSAIMFLHHFVAELAKPIARSDRAHVDYIPTQVVTEYLRTSPALRALGLVGLRYRSTRRRGGTCLVLFGGRELLELTPGERESLVELEQRRPGASACLRLLRTVQRVA